MSLKITFVNPNSSDEVDKYLPKILADAMINKMTKELTDIAAQGNEYDVRHSA